MSDQAENSGSEENLTPEQELEQLLALREQNADLAKEIQLKGGHIDPLDILFIRLNALIELLSPETRQSFEFIFEYNMNIGLTEASKKSALVTPESTGGSTPGGSGLFVPGQ